MSVGLVTFLHNLVLYVGGTFDDTWTWAIDGVPVDLTGVTARMQVRSTPGAADPPLVDISSAGGGIVLGGTAGTVRVLITSVSTDALTAGDAVYDIELTWPNGAVQKFARGAVSILPGVTR